MCVVFVGPLVRRRDGLKTRPTFAMIVGAHQDDDAVYVACGFTGSGFQFSPAIAALIASGMARWGKLPHAIFRSNETMAAKFKLVKVDRF